MRCVLKLPLVLLLPACADRTDASREEVSLCQRDGGTDHLSIDSLEVQDDELVVGVSHAGGCAEHEYALCHADNWLQGTPVEVDLTVRHDANNDPCDGLVVQSLRLDLTPLRDAYLRANPDAPGRIVFRVDELAIADEFDADGVSP